MTQIEIATVKRAIALLSSLIDQPQAVNAVNRRSPVTRFAQEYLAHNPTADISCAELWTFFQEVVQAGELPPLRKSTFLRQLPGALEAVFSVRKSHNIVRAGRRVRGFLGVAIRMVARPATVLELEPE